VIILAIDPGNVRSAYVVYDTKLEANPILNFSLDKNENVRKALKGHLAGVDATVIEMVASYGMPVGKTVFETCVAIGRFWELLKEKPVHTLYRKQITLELCNSTRAGDSNVRQRLIDMYGPPGTKKNPGVLYGFAKDLWAALAVAEAFKQITERNIFE
jgi:hypothetical protein